MRQGTIYQHLNGTIYFRSDPFSQILDQRRSCVRAWKQKACKIAMRSCYACVCVPTDDRFSRNLVWALCYLRQPPPNRWFLTRSQNCENRLLASSCLSVCLSVCLSAWNNSNPTERIIMKFDILSIFGKYTENFFFC